MNPNTASTDSAESIQPAPSATDGLITRETLAKQLNNLSTRTIIRYERMGMPFIALGNLRLYNPSSVRDWLLSHEKGRGAAHTAPRRGRPPGRRAA
jgi:hypothetical protein